MATLTESLANLEKQETEPVKLNPSKFVYNVQSGTKDVKVKWIVGGRAVNRKVYRNPMPIFGIAEKSFESPKAATSRKVDRERPVNASEGVVNIQVEPRTYNRDVKPENAVTQIVYGLHKLGGTGTDFAEAHVQKIEELKLLKQESGIELQFKQKEPKQGKWKSGL